MKIYITILVGLILSGSALADFGDVKLVLSGFETNEGQVIITIYQGAEGFGEEDSKPFRIIEGTVKDLQYTETVTLPEGEYAILVIHDINNNGELDTNFIGIPKEPIGASINKKKSRPDYDKSKFSVGKNGSLTLEIAVYTIF